MPATQLGTSAKGVLGLSQTITGIVLESTDFDFTIDKKPFEDQDGTITSVSYFTSIVGASCKGKLINGTTFSGNLATTLTLSSVPVYAGNQANCKFVIEGIKVGEQVKDYRTIDLELMHYPGMTLA